MQNRSTLSSSTDVTIHATATCTSIVVQRWRCDVCQEASFEDFHEACRHEQSCRGGPPKATQSQLPSSQTTTSSTTTTSISQPGQTRRQAAKRISDVYVSPEPSPQSTMTVTVKKRPHPKSQTRKSSNQATHSFFAPRKNAKRSTTTKAPTNNAKEKKATPTPASTQSSQPLTPESQNQSDDDSYNAVDVQLVRVKPAKKLSRAETIEEKVAILTAMVNDDMKKPALAGIFTNKSMQQLMSEQRQAEFQAQRRLERQRELERKQKRATSHPPDISTFIAKSTTKPMVLPVHCRQPVAPRISTHVGSIYPIPILPRDEVSFWMEIPSLRHQTHTRTRQQEQKQLFSEKLISSPNVLDAQDNHNDMLREAFANIFVPSKARKDAMLWSHKYGHQHNIDSVIGPTTQQAVGTLKQWIEDWCFARQRSLTRMKVRQEQLKKKKTNKIVYKQDRDEDSWDEDQLTNVYLLTGPPASGKTGLVHAVAKNCQCSVLEINTTMARSASALKHSIQEATQSCSTSDLFRQQASFQSTIQSQSLQDSDEESSSQKSRPTTSLTVILIDEVDLIYEGEGDAGFWNALISLTKTARCPIFLTATSLPQNLASIKYKHLALTRPSPMECSNKLLQVCREEGIVMSSGFTPDAIRQQLAWIANVYQCDLRKLLLQLQLYHATGMVTKEIEEKDKEVTQPTLHLSPMNVIQMPELHSVVPHCVPAERYSIVTIYGANFGLLSTRDVAVRLGCETCPARIVDRETIIVLCPPLRHDTGPSSRILDLSICSSIFGTLHGIAIKGEQLEDGSLLQGSKYLHVEYMIMDDDEQEDEECELDGSNHSSSKSIASLPTPEQGLVLWNKTLQETGWMEEPDLLPPAVEKNMLLLQQQLDDLAEEAHYASDAAYLEEAQRGYPYLSGACRGFGFDLTEEGGSAGGGKLTLNDKCRP